MMRIKVLLSNADWCYNSANIYLFKVNNRNTRKWLVISSTLKVLGCFFQLISKMLATSPEYFRQWNQLTDKFQTFQKICEVCETLLDTFIYLKCFRFGKVSWQEIFRKFDMFSLCRDFQVIQILRSTIFQRMCPFFAV